MTGPPLPNNGGAPRTTSEDRSIPTCVPTGAAHREPATSPVTMAAESRSHAHPGRRRVLVSAVGDSQTYRNIAYLLIAFPLGLFYAVVLILGLTIGLALSPLFVGVPVLIATSRASGSLIALEVRVANRLLGTALQTEPPRRRSGTWWTTLRTVGRDRRTWNEIIYLLLKLPIGVATLVITTTLVTTSLALTFAPAYAWANSDQDWALGGWDIDAYPWPFALVPAGLVLTAISVPVLNEMAAWLGTWSRGWLNHPGGTEAAAGHLTTSPATTA